MTLLLPRLMWNSPPILHQISTSSTLSGFHGRINYSYSRASRCNTLENSIASKAKPGSNVLQRAIDYSAALHLLPLVNRFHKLGDLDGSIKREQHKRNMKWPSTTEIVPKVVAKQERRQACRAHVWQNGISRWRPRLPHSQYSSSSARIPHSHNRCQFINYCEKRNMQELSSMTKEKPRIA